MARQRAMNSPQGNAETAKYERVRVNLAARSSKPGTGKNAQRLTATRTKATK